MNPFQDRPLLLESLSERVLRDLSAHAWRELFTRPPDEHIQIHSAPATVVAALFAAASDESPEELFADAQRIANACGGDSDVLHPGAALISFSRAELAFEAARQLQELGAGRRLRIGLAAGVCDIARVEIGGHVRTFLVGDAVERAQAVSTVAPAGTIRISPDLTVDLLDQIETLADRVVTTEFDDDGVATVSLALPPQQNEALSSFAGLGLT